MTIPKSLRLIALVLGFCAGHVGVYARHYLDNQVYVEKTHESAKYLFYGTVFGTGALAVKYRKELFGDDKI